MKIIAKRPFISSKLGIGNVQEGRILDADDGYATMLIKAGLAEKYSAAQALKASGQPSFSYPVGVNIVNGQSSQAAQASKHQTAKKSKSGASKTKTVRSLS
jgi:hypothetical protein